MRTWPAGRARPGPGDRTVSWSRVPAGRPSRDAAPGVPSSLTSTDASPTEMVEPAGTSRQHTCTEVSSTANTLTGAIIRL